MVLMRQAMRTILLQMIVQKSYDGYPDSQKMEG
jgi:hypothetical protein